MKKQIANPTELQIWFPDKENIKNELAHKIKGTSTRDCIDQAEKVLNKTFKTKQEFDLYIALRKGSTFWKKRSLNTFLRQQLKIKGSTEHTGRGVFVGEFQEGWNIILDRLKKKIEEWKELELIEDVEISDEEVKIVFTKDYFNEYYRTATFNKEYNCFGVIFSCSPSFDFQALYGVTEEEFNKLAEHFQEAA